MAISDPPGSIDEMHLNFTPTSSSASPTFVRELDMNVTVNPGVLSKLMHKMYQLPVPILGQRPGGKRGWSSAVLSFQGNICGYEGEGPSRLNPSGNRRKVTDYFIRKEPSPSSPNMPQVSESRLGTNLLETPRQTPQAQQSLLLQELPQELDPLAMSASFIEKLRFNSNHDEFTEPQVDLFCMLHAINNVCGFNSSDHFTVGTLDEAARLLRSPMSTSSAFEGYSCAVLERVIQGASGAGFSCRQWQRQEKDGSGTSWGLPEYMVNQLELLACAGVLRGLICHKGVGMQQHWLSHRLQSTGLLVELDSNIRGGAPFSASRQPHRTITEIVLLAQKLVVNAHHVFLIFHSACDQVDVRSTWIRGSLNTTTLVSHSAVGAVNPGNLCFAITSAVVASATLRHLGLQTLALHTLGLGWGDDPNKNTNAALRLAEQHIESLYTEAGNIIQNDYSEVMLGIFGAIPCLARATKHSGGVAVTESIVKSCMRSGISTREEQISTPVLLDGSDSALDLIGNSFHQLDHGDIRLCASCAIADRIRATSSPQRVAEAWFDSISNLSQNDSNRSAADTSTVCCNHIGGRVERGSLNSLPDVLWLDYGQAVASAALQEIQRPAIHVPSLRFKHQTGRDMQLVAAVFYNGTGVQGSGGHYWSLVCGRHLDEWCLVNDAITSVMGSSMALAELQHNPLLIIGLVYVAAESFGSEKFVLPTGHAPNGWYARPPIVCQLNAKVLAEHRGNQIVPTTPTAPPKKSKSTPVTYRKPRGRPPKNRIWDALNGTYVPISADTNDPSFKPSNSPKSLIPQPPGRPFNGRRWNGVLGEWVLDAAGSEPQIFSQPAGRPLGGHHWDEALGQWVLDVDGTEPRIFSQPAGRPLGGHHWDEALGDWVPDVDGTEPQIFSQPAGRPLGGHHWDEALGEWVLDVDGTEPRIITQPVGRPRHGHHWDEALGDWVPDVDGTEPGIIPQPVGRPCHGKHWDGVLGKWEVDGDGAPGEWTPGQKHKAYPLRLGGDERYVVCDPTPADAMSKLMHQQRLRDKRKAMLEDMREEVKRRANARASSSRRSMEGLEAMQRDVSSGVASKYNEPRVSKEFQKNLTCPQVTARLQGLVGVTRRVCAARIAAEQDASIHKSRRCDWCHESGLQLSLQNGVVLGADTSSYNGDYLCFTCRSFSKANHGARPVLAQCLADPGHLSENLTSMTLAEEMLVSRIHVRHAVYTVRQVAVKHKGHASFYTQDTTWVSTLLPHHPSTLPLVLVRAHDVGASEIAHIDLVVRPAVVVSWLEYKKRTCPHYADVEIDIELVNQMTHRAANDGCDFSPTSHNAFSVATDVESVVTSEWDLRLFMSHIKSPDSLSKLLCTLGHASSHRELTGSLCTSRDMLIKCVQSIPTTIGAFNIRLIHVVETIFIAFPLLCQETSSSVDIATLIELASDMTPAPDALELAVALCFFCKSGHSGSTHVNGLRLGIHNTKLGSQDSRTDLVAIVLEAWAKEHDTFDGCPALSSWSQGGDPMLPIRLCGPLCLCDHFDSCCCGGRLCKQNAHQDDMTADAGGAHVHSDVDDICGRNREAPDDEGSMEYSLMPFGGMFETRDQVASQLGFDVPGANMVLEDASSVEALQATGISGQHDAHQHRGRNSLIRSLNFDPTTVGEDADVMHIPVLSYPGLGLAAAPRVTNPRLDTPAAHFETLVDQRNRVSLFSNDVNGLVSMAFPSLVHNRLFDFFSPDQAVSETVMLRHLMAYTTPDGHMPFLEHPTFKYCMQNVLWRRQNNRLKSRVVDKQYQGMSLRQFREAVLRDESILNKVRSSTSSRPGSSASWWRFRQQLHSFIKHYQWVSEHFAPVGATQTEAPDQMFTIFYTVSAADAWWPVFHTQCTPESQQCADGAAKGLSANINPDSYEDYRARARKVRHYVGLAAQYFHWKHQCVLNGFIRASWGIVAHAWRVEMQKRQAMHYHGTVMLKHAPTLNMCLRACDAFQQHLTPDPCKNRARRSEHPAEGGVPELWDAVVEVVRYCDNVLGLTASDPLKCLCKSREKGYRAVKMHLNDMQVVGDWDDVYSELLRTAYEHRHSRAYCLRLRKHRSAQELQYSVQTAPRSELKCRFDAPWPHCTCRHCAGSSVQCRKANANGGVGECDWGETVELVLNCTCGAQSSEYTGLPEHECSCGGTRVCTCDVAAKGHQCKCDGHCHRGCHIHVIRNSTDEGSRRHFKVWPCRNQPMINCHVREGALVAMSNTDIQFLIDGMHAIEYMAKYMGKDEPSNPELVRNMKAATAAFKPPSWSSEDDASGLKALVQSLLNAQSGGRAYGMWEVACITQGIPLFGFSESKVDLMLGGACSLADLTMNENADLGDDDELEDTKFLKNDFDWYNKRPIHHAEVGLYDLKGRYTNTYKARESPAWVNLLPNFVCKLPVWGAQGDTLHQAEQLLEGWCVHQLLLFRPWRVNSQLRGEALCQAAILAVKATHPTCHAALRERLPGFVLQYELQLELREAPLVTTPLGILDWQPVNGGFTLPRIVVRDYHKAIATRGYRSGDHHDVDSDLGESESSTESEGYELSDDEDAACDEDFESSDEEPLLEDHDIQDDLHNAMEYEVAVMSEHLGETTDQIHGFNSQTCDVVNTAAETWLKNTRKEVGDAHHFSINDVADPVTLATNPWQAELFKFVLDSVNARKQVFVIVQGEGGTGKSHVVKCWRHPTALNDRIVVLAPTGVAALNIKGATIAQFLGFYPGQRYKKCDADVAGSGKQSTLLQRIRLALDGVKVIVIDERSMVGRGVHGMLKTRLEEAFPNCGPYGGFSIVWLGDDAQLPPVRACKLHDLGIPTKRKRTVCAKSKVIAPVDEATSAPAAPLGANSDPKSNADSDGLDWEAGHLEHTASAFEMVGLRAWEQHFNIPSTSLATTMMASELASAGSSVMVFHLVQNVRAINSPELLALTTRLRNGQVDQETYELLCSRRYVGLSANTRQEFAQSSVTIVDKQSKRVKANADALSSMCVALLRKAVCIQAQDTLSKTGEPCDANIPTTKAGGLQRRLYLCVGAQVMCTDNLWTCEGLVNGAMGTVRGIVYQNNLAQLPIVLVDFPSYSGPAFDSGTPTVVPIAPVTRQGLKVWHQGATVSVNRTQLPLQLASAITIHKSQGLTVGPGKHIERVIIDVGASESWCEGLAYVAISRAMFMECFALDPMQPSSRWASIGKSKGAERTHLWLKRLELTAACQHVSACDAHTSACRICQNIKLGQGSHADHNLQSIVTLKDNHIVL